MIDRERLAAWIRSRHLEDEALQAYRDAFTSHPAHVVVIEDFLVSEVAERLSLFLSGEAEFRSEHGLYSVEGAVSEEDWREAPDEDRLFRLGKLVGTPPRYRTSPNALTYLQFRMTFQQPEFRSYFETITGMPLGASDDFGAHAMTHEDMLRPHSDDNRNRQLALVLYLTPGWKPEFGGQLRVTHLDGGETVVEARYNSLVAFNVLTHSAHVVEPIRPGDGGDRTRLTIGGWYHKVA